MTPEWAELVGAIFVAVGVVSALVVLTDELLLGNRQQMWIMNVVHPVTALYWGPVWLWAYFTRARRSSRKALRDEAERLAQRPRGDEGHRIESADEPQVTRWDVSNATSHCGAGCTLGDISGEWLVYALGPLTLAGATVWPELAFDFVFAWTLGIAFQYFTIVPMRRGIGRLQGLWLAIRADTLSIIAFQVGLFSWMIFSATVLWTPALPIDSAAHWWMMQVGMILGFFTAYPVNRWLVGKGWKEKMDHRRHLGHLVDERRREVEEATRRPAARRAAA